MSSKSKLGIGLYSFKTAHSFIRKHNLWRFIIIPGILNTILFYLSFIWFLDGVSGWVSGFFDLECSDQEGFLGLLCQFVSYSSGVFEFFFKFFLYTAFIGVYLYLYKNLVLFIYSPVLAYLIEIVEEKHKGVNSPFSMEQFIKETVRGLVLALRGLIIEGIVVFLLLLMMFVPIINLVQPLLMWLVGAYFLGVSMIDYSLERKGYNIRDSINYSKKHKSLAIGVGSVFQLVFIVPFVGWMIAPTYTAVAAYFAVEQLDKLKINE